MSVPAASSRPEALDAVRDLERSLEGRRDGRALAEQRVNDAHRDAETRVAAARRRAEQDARRARQEVLVAADRDAERILATAEAQIISMRRFAETAREGLLAELRAAVLPTGSAGGVR